MPPPARHPVGSPCPGWHRMSERCQNPLYLSRRERPHGAVTWPSRGAPLAPNKGYRHNARPVCDPTTFYQSERCHHRSG